MGAFKLGKMTFGSLFKKPETLMYPLEKKPQPMGLKGHIAIEVGNCILCGMCDRSCSTNCISVDKQARTWTIDRLQCVQCGYCITVCPKKCLSMDPNYAPACTSRHLSVYEIKQEEAGEEKPAAAAAKKTEAPAADKSDAATAKEKEPAAAVPNEQVTEQLQDRQLGVLLGMMDADKAEKVRSALMG